MNPACPNCGSISTRRRTRDKSLGHLFMYLFGVFPWECIDCQERFFNRARYSKTKRHPLGEVYTGTKPTPKVKPGSDEVHPM